VFGATVRVGGGADESANLWSNDHGWAEATGRRRGGNPDLRGHGERRSVQNPSTERRIIHVDAVIGLIRSLRRTAMGHIQARCSDPKNVSDDG
jgi:hypothetical protein